MSDLTRLRELAHQFTPPEFEELTAVAARRRRRRSLAVAAAVATAASVALVMATGVVGVQRSSDPVGPPPPTPTWKSGEWPPERIKAEGTAARWDLSSGDATAPAARIWSVCFPKRCSQWGSHQQRHEAVEVSVDGFHTGALFELTRSRRDPRSIYLERYDDDTVFAVDVQQPGSLRDRIRLLDADGTQVPIELVGGTAPASPGPDVIRYQEELYRVDPDAHTLQRLDTPGPAHRIWWAAEPDEVLWGIGPGCDIQWQDSAGAWHTHQVACRGATPWFADPMPAGLMVVELDGDPDGISRIVSRDQGMSWYRYPPGVEPDFVTSDE